MGIVSILPNHFSLEIYTKNKLGPQPVFCMLRKVGYGIMVFWWGENKIYVFRRIDRIGWKEVANTWMEEMQRAWNWAFDRATLPSNSLTHELYESECPILKLHWRKHFNNLYDFPFSYLKCVQNGLVFKNNPLMQDLRL